MFSPSSDLLQSFSAEGMSLIGLFLLARMTVLWSMQTLTLSDWLTKRINGKPIPAEQRAREENWTPSVFASSLLMYATLKLGAMPAANLPFFDLKGFGYGILIHATLVEFVYYWVHRIMHWPRFYKHMHKHHHLSIVPAPLTSVSFLISEHLVYDALFAIVPVLVGRLGHGSTLFHMLWIPVTIDLFNTIGHLNFEIFPAWYVDTVMYYFFYTTSYHHVHHAYFNYNYALFMPIYDIMFGTYNEEKSLRDFRRAHAYDPIKKVPGSPSMEKFDPATAVVTPARPHGE